MNELEAKLVDFAKHPVRILAALPGHARHDRRRGERHQRSEGAERLRRLRGGGCWRQASGAASELRGRPAGGVARARPTRANQNVLGTLLNADPVQLQTQRESAADENGRKRRGSSDSIPSASSTSASTLSNVNSAFHQHSFLSRTPRPPTGTSHVSRQQAAALPPPPPPQLPPPPRLPRSTSATIPSDTFVRALYDFTSARTRTTSRSPSTPSSRSRSRARTTSWRRRSRTGQADVNDGAAMVARSPAGEHRPEQRRHVSVQLRQGVRTGQGDRAASPAGAYRAVCACSPTSCRSSSRR